MPVACLAAELQIDDPGVARGVELGLLYARLTAGEEDGIRGFFARANEQPIDRLVDQLGWRVVLRRPWGADRVLLGLERS